MNQTAKATIALLIFTGTTLAGPPLICHPFLIGEDTSLPWGSEKDNWDNPDLRYNTANLPADTLRLLDSGKTLLTRMETLRRAAVYTSRDTKAGLALATRLLARALAAEVRGQNDSLALFDAGYFAESLKQISHRSGLTVVADVDGYEWVKRSLPGLKEKLVAEFALGLMLTGSSWPNEHVRRAVAGAQEGSLLADNLAKFHQNRNLAEVRRTLGIKSASR